MNMTKVEMMKEKLERLERDLKGITKELVEIEESWGSHFNENDPNDMYQRTTFTKVEDKLSDVRRLIEGLNAPVRAEGRLYHNSAKRYEIEGSNVYFTSGSKIEFLHTWDDGSQEWIESSVDHNGEDYYLTRFKNVKMEGLKARAKNYPTW